jgi:hypothetical protein
MLIAHPEDRRRIEDETERALSPLDVALRWDYGDLVITVEGARTERISTASISWEEVVLALKTLRDDLRRAGLTLAEWEPPLPAPELQDTPLDACPLPPAGDPSRTG